MKRAGVNWNHFQHARGPALRAGGTDLNEAFVAGAHALMAYVLENPQDVRAVTAVDIFCESSDLDFLFSDWINTVIYEMTHKKMVFNKFEIHAEGINVIGKIWGETFQPQKHRLKPGQLLGAGFDELRVIENPGSVEVQCVLNEALHPLYLKSE